MTNTTILRLTRPKQYMDMARAYIVVVDGTDVGRIRFSESIDIPVAAGQHDIRLKIDWCGSNSLAIQAKNNQIVKLECGSSLIGWRILLAYLYISIWRANYLWIRPADNQEA